MENLAPLFADLADSGGGAWVDILQRSADDILDPSRHGPNITPTRDPAST